MDAVRRLASLARAVRDRDDVQLPVRQPLARARVAVPAQVRGPLFDDLLALFRSEVNVKSVVVVESDADLVRLKAKANFRSLGKRYGKDTPKAAAAAAQLGADQLRALESGEPVELTVDGLPYRYLPEDVVVEREVNSDWPVESDGPFVVALDPALDEGLKGEGLAREVISRVQRLRKDANYHYADRIRLAVRGDAVVVQAVSTHADFIKEETLARELILGSSLPASDVEQEIDIDGHQVTLAVRRHENGRPTLGSSDHERKST
jgi:isoleucyl-tRNA synthetase